MSEVDDFLAHYGVKGMRWGVRKSESTSGVSKSEARDAGIVAAKAALKYAAVPSAVAIGGAVGVPAVAALAVGIKVLQDPAVQAAASTAATYVKNSVGDISMSSIPNPFSSSTSDAKSASSSSSSSPKVELEGLPKEKPGGMFNPDADISGGKVKDVGNYGDQAASGWDPADHVKTQMPRESEPVSPASVLKLGAGIAVGGTALTKGITTSRDSAARKRHSGSQKPRKKVTS